MIPLFPELRPYLERAFADAPEGTTYVVRRYRDTNVNLRTQLLRIIERAGLAPWPKLFQNLRASRQTELEERFPSHVVCAWMGNSQPVARKHYLMVTEDHFAQAISANDANGGAQIPAPKATQKATQTMAETPRQRATGFKGVERKSFPVSACRKSSEKQVAEAGLEPARGLPPRGF